MKKGWITFLIVLIGMFVFPAFSAGARSASDSVSVSLAVEAYVKCTVQGDEMTITQHSKKNFISF